MEEIKCLDENISLTNPTQKIRIAVLDSGIRDTDTILRTAIRSGLINPSKSRSFVSQRPEDWREDTHGHGTHVTRLLLQTARASEVYVGKICRGKMIDEEFMSGIAKVCLHPSHPHNS